MLQDFRFFFFLALLIIVYKKKMREVNEKRKVFYVYIHTVVSVMEGKKEAEVEDGNEKS